MYTLILAALQITNPVVSIGVQPINEISIQSISVPTNIPFYPATVTTQSSYAITTNGDFKKITGSLDQPLPSNLLLSITLQAPNKAQSQGQVPLSSQSKTLVSNISRVAQNNLNIIYKFSSTGPVLAGACSTTVRLTLTD